MTELKTDLEDTGMSKYLVEPALPIPFASNYYVMRLYQIYDKILFLSS